MLPGKTPTIPDIIDMVKRRILLLLVPPVVTLFLALAYSSTLPDVFQSSVLIAIVPQRVPDSFVRSTVTLRTEDRLDAIATQVTSRTALEQLILEFDLYPDMRLERPMEDVVTAMRTAIDTPLEPLRRGPRGLEPPHAFRVNFKYTDAVIATRVANRLAAMFADQNTRDRGALAEATDRFLEEQLAQARVRLEEQEARLERFREVHGNELPTQVLSNMQVIQNTQMQIQALVEGMARDNDRKLLLERLYSEAVQEPAPVQQQPPAAAAARGADTAPAGATASERLAAARQTLSALELRLTPLHPDVVRLKRTVTELEAAAREETAAAASATGAPIPPTTNPLEAQRRERLREQRAEIESLDRQRAFKEAEEKRLRALVAEYQRRIEAVPGLESEWAALSRDYETMQTAYRELREKSEAAKVAVDLERRSIGEQFRVVDEAQVPTRPISPIRFQISGAGFGIGLVLGLVTAALLEIRDRSFRTDADVLNVLRLPVLAAMPLVLTADERSKVARRRWMASALGAGAAAAAGYVFWTMRLWTQLI